MNQQEFKELFSELDTKEKEAQKVVSEIKKEKKKLFKEYSDERPRAKVGEIASDDEKSIIVDKVDYTLNLLTELPTQIYYGFKCSQTGKELSGRNRATVFQFNLIINGEKTTSK